MLRNVHEPGRRVGKREIKSHSTRKRPRTPAPGDHKPHPISRCGRGSKKTSSVLGGNGNNNTHLRHVARVVAEVAQLAHAIARVAVDGIEPLVHLATKQHTGSPAGLVANWQPFGQHKSNVKKTADRLSQSKKTHKKPKLHLDAQQDAV